MKENELVKIAVHAAFEIHTELGPGLLESVYEILLEEQGLVVEQQRPIPIKFRSKTFIKGFKADLVVDSLLLIELKSVEQLLPVDKKQTQTYLRLSNLRLGLLINFNSALIKNGILRVVYGLPDADEVPL